MSDVLSPIQTLKFKNILSFGDKSPHFPYKSKSDEIVLTLNLSCAFLRELGNAKSVYNCSYITILNTQISVFQLIENDRLESRIKSQLYSDIPRKYLLVQCRNDLDKVFHIERIPGNVPGAYISVKDELSRVLSNWCIENENQIKVKFSGDGVKITRTSGFLVFSFSVMKGRQKTESSSSQYTVAIVNCGESYDNLRDACMPFLNEVNEIARHGKVCVGDSDVPVELFVGGDMKFLQLILGLNGATSNYACPWCHVEKTNRSDTSKPWNYYPTDDMCRTTRKIKNLYFNRCDNKYSVTHRPLIEVDPDHAVPDELHLLLRIVDVLLRNLIDDVNDMDSVSKVKGRKADRLIEFVEKCNSCGINFQVWKDKAGKLDWTSLTGPDVNKLLCQLPDKLYFIIHRDTHDETMKLWRDFRSIYQLINSNECVDMDPVMLFEKCQSTVELFRDLGKKEERIPRP